MEWEEERCSSPTGEWACSTIGREWEWECPMNSNCSVQMMMVVNVYVCVSNSSSISLYLCVFLFDGCGRERNPCITRQVQKHTTTDKYMPTYLAKWHTTYLNKSATSPEFISLAVLFLFHGYTALFLCYAPFNEH